MILAYRWSQSRGSSIYNNYCFHLSSPEMSLKGVITTALVTIWVIIMSFCTVTFMNPFRNPACVNAGLGIFPQSLRPDYFLVTLTSIINLKCILDPAPKTCCDYAPVKLWRALLGSAVEKCVIRGLVSNVVSTDFSIWGIFNEPLSLSVAVDCVEVCGGPLWR